MQANSGYHPESIILLNCRFSQYHQRPDLFDSPSYAQFRLLPLGRQRVTVCRGTACHIRGASQILGEAERVIGINEGETTNDQKYTLETVACIGCCALAPCIRINNNVYGEMISRKGKRALPCFE